MCLSPLISRWTKRVQKYDLALHGASILPHHLSHLTLLHQGLHSTLCLSVSLSYSVCTLTLVTESTSSPLHLPAICNENKRKKLNLLLFSTWGCNFFMVTWSEHVIMKIMSTKIKCLLDWLSWCWWWSLRATMNNGYIPSYMWVNSLTCPIINMMYIAQKLYTERRYVFGQIEIFRWIQRDLTWFFFSFLYILAAINNSIWREISWNCLNMLKIFS